MADRRDIAATRRVMVNARWWVDAVWDSEGRGWVAISDQGRLTYRLDPAEARELGNMGSALAEAAQLVSSPPDLTQGATVTDESHTQWRELLVAIDRAAGEPERTHQTRGTDEDSDSDDSATSWVSMIDLTPGADGNQGGAWRLVVTRVSDRPHWDLLVRDAAASRGGMAVTRSPRGLLVRVEVADLRPFRDAAADYELDLRVFGSPTLWPAPHHRLDDAVAGWMWTHTLPDPFPFSSRQAP